MASGSSGRLNSRLDFASDSSYDDYVNPDKKPNATHSDPSLATNSTKDFQKSRISSSPVFPTTVYHQPEEPLNQELLLTVERTIKKYTDNLLRFLEGISSRLSQLELYCYNLDKSIEDMRSDLDRNHGDADSKLKFLEKHLQEVHRSIQILRDKQELAETQKELAKVQLAQDSPSAVLEESAISSVPDCKKNVHVLDSPNNQLVLALPLPSPVSARHSNPTLHQQSSAPQPVSPVPPYYLLSPQLPNPQNHSQLSYLSPDAQYPVHQLEPQPPQPTQVLVNQIPQSQQYPQYQQWPQEVSQPMPPPQQQPMLPPQQPPIQPGNLPGQMRSSSSQSQVYLPYVTNLPANSSPEATQGPFTRISHPGAGQPEALPYSYGSSQPQHSPPHMEGGFPSQQGHGLIPPSSGGTYMLYDSESGRPHHTRQPSHYFLSGYPPSNPPLPNMPPPNSNSLMIRNGTPQQYVRGHPFSELIDKMVSIGYRVDHVVSVIESLEESGQSVDFNAVLDRLSGHSTGSSQRSW